MRPDDNQETAEMCLCPGCPTYNDCMRSNEERLFCARGKSACDVSAVECICSECPVWASFRLDSYYFCMRGAAS